MMTSTWSALAQAVHRELRGADRALIDRYPWKDNVWFVFWDAEQRVSGMIHASTSCNGAPRTARAVLAWEGRVLSVDEVPDVGSLSSPSIDVSGALLPDADVTGSHRIIVRAENFGFDLTLVQRWEPMDWTVLDLIPPLSGAPALNHWQQGFTAEGLVTMEGRQLRISGGGFRDRTWGWRAESLQFNELYGVNVGLERCDISMCKFLLSDGTTKAAGYIQHDAGLSVIRGSELSYNKAGLAAALTITSDDLAPLELSCGPADAGWWLTFNKHGKRAPVWTEYHHLCAYDGGAWGKGYGCVAHDVLRRLS